MLLTLTTEEVELLRKGLRTYEGEYDGTREYEEDRLAVATLYDKLGDALTA